MSAFDILLEDGTPLLTEDGQTIVTEDYVAVIEEAVVSYVAASFANAPTSPAKAMIAVTPSDTAAIVPTKYIIVAAAGNVSLVLTESPTPVVFTNVPAMTRIDGEVVKVMASGTTSTNVIACY